ncbi:Uncharacterised protein [Mycobacterium tuberculosis]|nr:Uncharacterised protein [Mycobacterium tuberculosis]
MPGFASGALESASVMSATVPADSWLPASSRLSRRTSAAGSALSAFSAA